MKRLIFISFALLLGTAALGSTTPSDPVTIICDGRAIQAKLLEKGSVNFFESTHFENQLVSVHPTSLQTEQVPINRYFLGNDQGVEEVTSDNYKAMVKKYLPNAPELHKRLGKFGFRFENIRYMVQFYNKFKVP